MYSKWKCRSSSVQFCMEDKPGWQTWCVTRSLLTSDAEKCQKTINCLWISLFSLIAVIISQDPGRDPLGWLPISLPGLALDGCCAHLFPVQSNHRCLYISQHLTNILCHLLLLFHQSLFFLKAAPCNICWIGAFMVKWRINNHDHNWVFKYGA